MDIIISLLSFFWQQSKFSLLENSLDQLRNVDIPTISLGVSEHTNAPLQIPPLKKSLAKFTEIRAGDKKKTLIALTFDDGFDPAIATSELATLKEKQVTSTFFLKGNWIAENPAIVDTIIKDGHELGNHSYDHPDFKKIAINKAIWEIDTQENLLTKDHHYSPKPYFRFPYGSRTPKLQQLLHNHGYTAIAWDIDTLDWQKDSNYVKNQVLTKAHNGAIVLMHLGKESSAKVLADVIDQLRAKGFTIVSLSQLLDADDNIT